MTKRLGLASLLLITSALVAPNIACAQTAPSASDTESEAQDQALPAQDQTDAQEDEAPDVSVPGGDIVVVGRRANVQRDTAQVVSLLTSADIARTGEGDIAGALSHVTGLSVVGNGYVYVRGLGDRYSLALLNGSPLPSPEPLKRVVPLDLFPTNVISSSLVQKSYSVNYPGEFGGGVINLTTNAIPKQGFLTLDGGIGANLRTTGNLGYVYAGGSGDWTGYDDGTRNQPPLLKAFLASGQRLDEIDAATNSAIAGQLINAKNALVQKQKNIGPNWSLTVSGGQSFAVGGATLGVIATAGYRNDWSTIDSTQQQAFSSNDLSQLQQDFQRVSTSNHTVANALLGLGLEFGDNKIRWTNLYIHDTLKFTRLGIGNRHDNLTSDFLQQDTAWYARQLFDSQVVAELKFGPAWSLDLRGGYANTKRKAPDEISLEYVRSNSDADPYGDLFVNRLTGNNGNAEIAFSNLNEDLWSGGADLTFKPFNSLGLSVGYAYYNSDRNSSRRDFQFRAPVTDTFNAVSVLRPDLLFGSAIIKYFGVQLIDQNPGTAEFDATLVTHAGYGRVNWQVTPKLSVDAGVRYETGKETVAPVQVFNTPVSSLDPTTLDNDYWLPGGTITWQFQQDMQFRANASKTIARPQFRELLPQPYFDPETNRQYSGNPLLQDSKLFNAELRYEWYFARDQHLSIAGFYKKLDKPIEAFVQTGDDFITSYANAPKADLYGIETEVQKTFPLANWVSGSFFESRNLLAIANYTYTHSQLKVKDSDTVQVYGASFGRATDYFRDGAPLTGQSDHLANFEIGFEDTDHLSQQTFILSYASKRVTSRGVVSAAQPDIFEYPGFNLDFVMRQGVKLVNHEFDLKFEARNITDNRYRETQSDGTNTVIYNRYRTGPSLKLSVSTKF